MNTCCLLCVVCCVLFVVCVVCCVLCVLFVVCVVCCVLCVVSYQCFQQEEGDVQSFEEERKDLFFACKDDKSGVAVAW